MASVSVSAEFRQFFDSIECISFCQALEQIVHGVVNVKVAYQIRIAAVLVCKCAEVIAPKSITWGPDDLPFFILKTDRIFDDHIAGFAPIDLSTLEDLYYATIARLKDLLSGIELRFANNFTALLDLHSESPDGPMTSSMHVDVNHSQQVLSAQQSLLLSQETMDALEDALVKLVRRETTSELELSSMARTSATSIIALQASSNSKRQIMTTNWILGEETPDVRRGIELPPAIIFGTLREKYLGQSIIAPHGAPDSFGKTHGYPTRRADEVSGDARCITSVYVDEARSEYDSLNDELRANDYMSGKGTSINNQLAGEFSDQAAENGDLLLQQLGRERGPGSRTFTATVSSPLHAHQSWEDIVSKDFDHSSRRYPRIPFDNNNRFVTGSTMPDSWANEGYGGAPVSILSEHLASRCGTKPQSNKNSMRLALRRTTERKQQRIHLRSASTIGQRPCVPFPRPKGFHGAWDSSCGLPVKEVEARLAILRWQCIDHDPKSALFLYKSRLSLQVERGLKLGPKSLVKAGIRRLFHLQQTMVAPD